MERRQQGMAAEEAAARYLGLQGLRLRARNYHCRQGEIDLICEDRETLVFVEVRFRRPGARVSPLDSISRQKMRRIIHAARHYLYTQCRREPRCRFDVVAVGHTPDGQYDCHWIPNAFDAHV